MAKSAILRARVDVDKMNAAERVFSQLGISVGEAIDLFLAQVSIQKGIPFALTTRPHLDLENASIREIESRYAERIPTTKTSTALNEKPSKSRSYKTATEFLKALRS